MEEEEGRCLGSKNEEVRLKFTKEGEKKWENEEVVEVVGEEGLR